MKLKEVQKEDVKDVVVTARITKNDSKWLKENNVSPSLLFEKALEELRKNSKGSSRSQRDDPLKKRIKKGGPK